MKLTATRVNAERLPHATGLIERLPHATGLAERLPHTTGLARIFGLNLQIALSLSSLTLFSTFAAVPPPLPPLTTVSGSPRLPGKFVWADLVTDDVSAAQNFYGPLFGWTFMMTGDYTIAANGERPLCGMIQRARPKDKPAQPRWFGYISTKNVEKAQSKAVKLGGRVLFPTQQFPKRGEQAVLADQEGAVFGVMKSSAGDPEDLLTEPGDWIWIQLLSRDARKAAQFYRGVAGYEVVENTTTNGLSDYVLVSEGYARATVRTIQSTSPEVRPTWLLFVRVANLSDSLAHAKELGGKILIEPVPERFQSKVAVIADPSGAAVGLLEWSHDLARREGAR